jgi:hypothetical protein
MLARLAMPDTPEPTPDRYVTRAARACDCFEVQDTWTETAVVGCTAMPERAARLMARQMSSTYRRATSAGSSPP